MLSLMFVHSAVSEALKRTDTLTKLRLVVYIALKLLGELRIKQAMVAPKHRNLANAIALLEFCIR